MLSAHKKLSSVTMPDDSDEDIGDESNEDDFIAANGDREAVAAAHMLVSQNPMKLFELRCNGKVKETVERGVLVEYIQRLFALPSCYSKYSKRFTACSCLRDLQENAIFDIIADRLSE